MMPRCITQDAAPLARIEIRAIDPTKRYAYATAIGKSLYIY